MIKLYIKCIYLLKLYGYEKNVAIIIFSILIGCYNSPPTKLSTETQVIKKNWNNSKKAIGRVKWFNDENAFGFISQENGDDVFVHHSSIRCKGFKTLFAGDKVEFEIDEERKGSRASIVVKV
jgi:CspA family cold shock protein